MKRVAILMVLAVTFVLPALAQEDHGEFGIFADYFRYQPTKTGFVGAGARLGFNFAKVLGIEAEANYDFARNLNGTGFLATNFAETRLHMLHGMLGPKVTAPIGPLRVFFTVKGGATNFNFSNPPVTFGTVGSAISGANHSNTKGIFYYGGGASLGGRLAIRADVGDEIFWLNGSHHNLRITAGPILRF